MADLHLLDALDQSDAPLKVQVLLLRAAVHEAAAVNYDSAERIRNLEAQWAKANGALAFAKWALGISVAIIGLLASLKLKLFGGHAS